MGIYLDFSGVKSEFTKNIFTAINTVLLKVYGLENGVNDTVNFGDGTPEKPCVAGSIPALSTSKAR